MSKLVELQSQLRQLETLLEADPLNEQLLLLKDELVRHISKYTFLPRTIVEYSQNSVNLPCILLSIDTEYSCTIQLLDAHEPSQNIPISSLKPATNINQSVTAPLVINDCYRALYPMDGKIYNARLVSLNKIDLNHQVQSTAEQKPSNDDDASLVVAVVEFDGYGNVSVLPLSYLKPVDDDSEWTMTAASKNDTDDIRRKVPRSLANEDVDKKPKKPSVASVGNNRSSTSTWKSWQKETDKKKESIFTTPDTVHGRVGFTGSGKEMTSFIKRKRMRKDEL